MYGGSARVGQSSASRWKDQPAGHHHQSERDGRTVHIGVVVVRDNCQQQLCILLAGECPEEIIGKRWVDKRSEPAGKPWCLACLAWWWWWWWDSAVGDSIQVQSCSSGGAAVAESVALLAPDQQILVLTSLGPSPPVIGGGPLIPGAARVTTRLSNKFGEREPVVQCRPGESERAI